MVKTRITFEKSDEREAPSLTNEEGKALLSRFQMECLQAKLPENLPSLAFASFSSPSFENDADFFASVIHDPERVDLILGDVSLKGPEAFILALHLKESIPKENLYSDLELLLRKDLPSPIEIVKSMESIVTQEFIAKEAYALLSYARIDLSKNRLTFLGRGGMPLVLQKKGGDLFLLQTEHPPLPDLKESLREKEEEADLEAGDRIFLLSDGVLLASNGRGESFGVEKVAKCLEDTKTLPLADVIEETKRSLHSFMEGHLRNDLFFLGVEILSDSQAVERIVKEEKEENVSFQQLLVIQEEIESFVMEEKRFKWSPKEIFQIKLVTHELALTLLKFLQENGFPPQLQVEKTAVEDGVCLTFLYQGPPFHPNDAKKQSGWGFALSMIQKNVNTIKYGERGKELSFVEITKLHKI